MKKVLIIMLVFLAFTHVAGFMPFYYVLLCAIKNEVRMELGDESILKQVAVGAAEFSDARVFNTVGQHEFRYKGKMYDFTSMKKCDNSYVFMAMEDDKETILIDLLKTVFEQDHKKDKNSNSPVKGLFKNFDKDFIVKGSAQFVFIELHESVAVKSKIVFTSTGYVNPAYLPPDARFHAS